MSSSNGKPVWERGGGLLLGERLPRKPLLGASPLTDMEDVSWLPHCQVGDNQGQDGACAIFAMASWAEIMHRTPISSETRIELYRWTLHKLGRKDGGLTYDEAFAAARDAGWLPGATGLDDSWDLRDLREQPLLGGYDVTPAWNASWEGSFDHDAPAQSSGRHAVVIVAAGRVKDSEPRVYVENSWGLDWGWNGIGVMSQSLHEQLCKICLKVV